MKNRKYANKVKKAIAFLDEHPALNTTLTTFTNNLDWILVDVCKNGYYCWPDQKPKDITVKVWRSDVDNFDELVKTYGKLLNNHTSSELSEFDSVEIPYEKHFGYPWKYKKTIYESEYCFFVYQGDNVNDVFDDKNWQACQGGDISADTWEKLLLKIEKDVKRKFGDYRQEKFWKKNTLTENNIKNKTWLKWFKNTKHYKKHWKNIEKQFVKTINSSKLK